MLADQMDQIMTVKRIISQGQWRTKSMIHDFTDAFHSGFIVFSSVSQLFSACAVKRDVSGAQWNTSDEILGGLPFLL